MRTKLRFIGMLCIGMLMSTMGWSQEDNNNYVMYESIVLTPDNTKLKVLSENMRKHNQKYHNKDMYKTTVYNINNGPNSGKIVWMMGPVKYTHLDGRPAEGGHDEDWRDNVMPYVKHLELSEFWRMEPKYSNMSMMDGTAGNYPLLFVRYWDVEKGEDHNVGKHLEMVTETFKAMPGENPLGVYDNEMRQGNRGRHLATVSFHKNWTEFDEPSIFRENFDKVHGKEAWDAFVKNAEKTFSDSWDEVWVYNKAMSGD